MTKVATSKERVNAKSASHIFLDFIENMKYQVFLNLTFMNIHAFFLAPSTMNNYINKLSCLFEVINCRLISNHISVSKQSRP